MYNGQFRALDLNPKVVQKYYNLEKKKEEREKLRETKTQRKKQDREAQKQARKKKTLWAEEKAITLGIT